MSRKFLLSFIASVLVITSCSTDFDVNAPYKETMVIFGLLDTKASKQYIRISKAFLGEGNALVMAQQPDSFNYGDVLDVTIEKLGSVGQVYILNRDTTIPKESGVFASPDQVYYTTTHPIVADGSEYRLTVTNRESGNVATSTTKVVGDIVLQHPLGTIIDFTLSYPLIVDFAPVQHALSYDFQIRFHYAEISASGDTSQHSVDWNFGDIQADYEDFSGNIEFTIHRRDFYEIIGNSIPVVPGVTRRVDIIPPGILPIELRVFAGTEDLYTYERLLKPSGTFLTDPPLFTTVENGLGIFSSRVTHIEYRDLSNNTKLAFDTSAYVRDLNFEF